MSPEGIHTWNCRAAGQGAECVWLHSAESEPGYDPQAMMPPLTFPEYERQTGPLVVKPLPPTISLPCSTHRKLRALAAS